MGQDRLVVRPIRHQYGRFGRHHRGAAAVRYQSRLTGRGGGWIEREDQRALLVDVGCTGM